MKSLFKAVALLTFFSLLARIAGFLFRIYLSRTIGTEQLGVYQIAFSVFIVILTIVSSGLPLTISKLTAKYTAENKKDKIHGSVSAALIIGIITSIVICLVLIIFNKVLGLIFTDTRCIQILIVLLPSAVFSAVYAVLRGVLWGHNKYFAVSLVEFGEQLSRIIICMFALSILFEATEGAYVAGASLSIACLLSMIAIIIIYFKTGGRLKSPKGCYKEVIKSSVPITGIRIATSLIQPIIAILLPMRMVSAGYTNEYALSQFGIAMGMTFPLLFLPTTLIGSLSLALIPDLASALALNNHKHVEERARNAIIFSFFISALCVPVFISLGVPLCEFVFNNTQAGIYLKNAAILMVPLSITNITSSILNSLGLEVKTFKNYMFGAAFLLLSIWFLPKYIAANSLIIGMGLCTSIPSVLNIIKIMKVTKSKKGYLKPIILLLVFILPVSLLTSNCYSLLIKVFPSLVALILCGMICTLSYATLCEVFSVVEIRSFIHLKQKTKSESVKVKKCFVH